MIATPSYSRSVEAIQKELGNAVFAELVQKASGQCYLCEEALDLQADEVQKDHVDPHGPTLPYNLYLAHRGCNALKRDLLVDDAKRMIRFRKFCETKKHEVTFDDVLEEYMPGTKRQPVKVVIDGNDMVLRFSKSDEVKVNVMIDPTSDVRYCFLEVPITHICNDTEVQPRKINWDHAWKLAQDFAVHPVHEPSSCRLVTERAGTGRLMQFDGQHKTAAQIIMGRTKIQTKLYLDPPLPLIRSLIVSIQSKIVKLPLEISIALTKLSDVYRDHWEQGGFATEADFIKSYRSDQQAGAKRELLSALYRSILENPNGKMTSFVQPRKARRGAYPLSMNNLINLILKELLCHQQLTSEVATPEDPRPEETANIVDILNQLADELLLDQKWQFERPKEAEASRDHLKAQRFFTPGAVRYWAPLLKQAIGYAQNLHLANEMDRPLLRKLDDQGREIIRQVVKRLCEHPVWTDRQHALVDGMLRENRPASSKELFEHKYQPALTVAYLMGVPGN